MDNTTPSQKPRNNISDCVLLNKSGLWCFSEGKYKSMHSWAEDGINPILKDATHRFIHESIIYEYDGCDLHWYNTKAELSGQYSAVNVPSNLENCDIFVTNSFILIPYASPHFMVLEKYQGGIPSRIEKKDYGIISVYYDDKEFMYGYDVIGVSYYSSI